MEYETLFLGLSQKVGATWLEPARLTTMLLVTSRAVTPATWARVRSISTSNPGLDSDCWLRVSPRPGTWRSRRSSFCAAPKFVAAFGPRSCKQIERRRVAKGKSGQVGDKN